jgi:molybdopterin synthase sulfur carrier subunit
LKIRNRIVTRMKKYKVKAFGITKDIVGGRETTLEITGQTVAELREELEQRFPQLLTLKSMFIAVNQNYADDNLSIQETDEIALIPPVSGG